MESYIPDELREENYKLAQLYIESEDKKESSKTSRV